MKEYNLFNQSIKVIVPDEFEKHKDLKFMNVELFVNEAENVLYNIVRNDVSEPENLLEYVKIKKAVLMRQLKEEDNSLQMEILSSDKYMIYCMAQVNKGEGEKVIQYSFMYKMKERYYTSTLVFVKEENEEIKKQIKESIKEMIACNL